MNHWTPGRILGLSAGVLFCIFGLILAAKALKLIFGLVLGIILLFVGYTLVQRHRPR